MQLHEFICKTRITEGDDKLHIRETYCSSFFNVESDEYKVAIETKYNFSDGFCYSGYLWDYLSSPVQIGVKYLVSEVKKLKEIYVLWDIHSCERIFIENYWKFEKDDILLLDGNILTEALHLLPEDIYIFDSSYTWTMILTHEYLKDERYCLKMIRAATGTIGCNKTPK